ncbi:MAG TPA: 23S rRNA (pseudouridine(1915)-N(3))-methyltransferase RlmH [Thermoanaerobacterales bacterium]|nr:23S rRNA (pseudouridine(1915)-N(3))-methyltransferase RlmH [Thermoanaerobacterales bacterium]
MKITIIAVGKINKGYIRDGIRDFVTRLKPYSSVEIIEIIEEQAPDGIGEKLKNEIKEREGERILKRINKNTYIIALDIRGTSISSDKFSDKINKLALSGDSHITFIIGGSYGLSPNILRASNFIMSFSTMTFPHQLMRLILLEQIYRAFKIIRGEPYHK